MRSFLAPKQSPRGEADAKATARKSMDEVDLNVKGMREKQDNQQLKTFTRWWNSWLQMRGIKLDDLVNDTKTGVAAMNLIELLSSSLVGKYNSDPKMRFHYLENQLAFLQQLKQKNIRLVNIGAEDLVEGNKTLILGLTWTLILRYEIQKYGAEVDELLRWVRLCTKNYPGVDVSNWGNSFNDGLAFCALINKHAPDQLDFSKLDTSDPVGCLKKAFQVAEDKFGVPQLLDAEELASPGATDDKSIIVYTAKLRQAFADQADEVKRKLADEEAARLRAERAVHATHTPPAAPAHAQAHAPPSPRSAAGPLAGWFLLLTRDSPTPPDQAHRAATKKLKDAFDAGVNDWTKWTGGKQDKFAKDAANPKALGSSPDETTKLLHALRNDFRQGEKPCAAAPTLWEPRPPLPSHTHLSTSRVAAHPCLGICGSRPPSLPHTHLPPCTAGRAPSRRRSSARSARSSRRACRRRRSRTRRWLPLRCLRWSYPSL